MSGQRNERQSKGLMSLTRMVRLLWNVSGIRRPAAATSGAGHKPTAEVICHGHAARRVSVFRIRHVALLGMLTMRVG
jgi:hypothetical protein